MTHEPSGLQERMAAAIDDPAASDRLSIYFASYGGGHFERLDGGGDRADAANRISAADLVAVTMLSVSVPPLVAVALLEGDLGRRVGEHLERIDPALAIYAPEADLTPDSHAWAAWTLLERPHGMGWVTAGKLLARKRPQLVPVYDRVIRCYLGKPISTWAAFQEALRADQNALVALLSQLRHRSGIGEDIGLLRVLDVAMWMAHAPAHRAGVCDAV